MCGSVASGFLSIDGRVVSRRDSVVADAGRSLRLRAAKAQAVDLVSQCQKGRSRMYQKILLAFDGSPDGREALAQAEALASACGATVHLLAIIDPSESMLIVEAMSFIPDNQRFVIQAVFDEGVRRLRGAGCAATSELKYGKPTEQIILSAREIDADLIVVGHRDQGTLARWLNGSVGESILHQPPCSVLVAVKSERRASNVTPIQQLKARGK
jgi:nucleotide-binding universal stress UspA family protein